MNAGEDLVRQDPEGPEIAARVGLLRTNLLGRHVHHGPEQGALFGQALLDALVGLPELRQPEI